VKRLPSNSQRVGATDCVKDMRRMRRKVPPNAQLVVDSDRIIWNFYISFHNPFSTGFCGRGRSPLCSLFLCEFHISFCFQKGQTHAKFVHNLLPARRQFLCSVEWGFLGLRGVLEQGKSLSHPRNSETLRQRCVFGRLWPKIKLAFWVFYCMDTSFKQSTKRLIKCKIIQMGQPRAEVIGFGGLTKGASSGG